MAGPGAVGRGASAPPRPIPPLFFFEAEKLLPHQRTPPPPGPGGRAAAPQTGAPLPPEGCLGTAAPNAALGGLSWGAEGGGLGPARRMG